MLNTLPARLFSFKEKMAFQIFLLHLIVLLTYIGLALPFSIFPILFITSHQPHGLLIYSLIISTYPIGQAIGMAIFGHLSDTYGRRKILQITLLGALITFILSGVFIVYKCYFSLIMIRFLCGLFEGNAVIAMAAISDLHYKLGNKTKWFGRINIALTCGFLIGPLLGSIFSNNHIASYFNYSTPFFVASLVSFFTLILVTVFFTETCHKKNAPNQHHDVYLLVKKSLKNITYFLNKPSVGFLLVANLFVTAAVDILYQFIPVYLVSQWSASSTILAFSVMILSVGKIFGNGYFLNFLLTKLSSNVFCIIIGLVAIIVCLFLLMYLKLLSLFFILVLLLGVFISLSVTNSITLVSNYTSKYKQGSVLSVASSLRLLIGTIMCNIAAAGCNISFKAPFLMSGILSLTALTMFFYLIVKTKLSHHILSFLTFSKISET